MGGKLRHAHTEPSEDSESRRQRIGALFEEYLRDALTAAGFVVEHAEAIHPGVDLIATLRGTTYAVELKSVPVVRRGELRATLAGAILEASAWSRSHGATPVAVVAAPRLSRRAVADLTSYASRVAPEVPIVLLSFGESPKVIGDEGLRSALEGSDPVETNEADTTASKSASLFSDLNCWMLKVLLAPGIEPSLLDAPRTPVASSSELAEVAGVSQPSAWRFLRALEQEGYLRPSPHYALQRTGDLLMRWSQSVPQPKSMNAVWLLPRGDHAKQLEEALRRVGAPSSKRRGHRGCLALFAACSALGLGHARGAVTHLYLEDVGDMKALGLAAAADGEQPHVVVQSPTMPEAVFRASVAVGGVPTADVVQCWLDARNHRARGREQADYLWKTALSDAVREK